MGPNLWVTTMSQSCFNFLSILSKVTFAFSMDWSINLSVSGPPITTALSTASSTKSDTFLPKSCRLLVPKASALPWGLFRKSGWICSFRQTLKVCLSILSLNSERLLCGLADLLNYKLLHYDNDFIRKRADVFLSKVESIPSTTDAHRCVQSNLTHAAHSRFGKSSSERVESIQSILPATYKHSNDPSQRPVTRHS